jgi:hypothetical protein
MASDAADLNAAATVLGSAKSSVSDIALKKI